MAGIAGFEPANTGVKVRCLTAWRYPNMVRRGMLFGNPSAKQSNPLAFDNINGEVFQIDAVRIHACLFSRVFFRLKPGPFQKLGACCDVRDDVLEHVSNPLRVSSS